jgi:hypothetical protein
VNHDSGSHPVSAEYLLALVFGAVRRYSSGLEYYCSGAGDRSDKSQLFFFQDSAYYRNYSSWFRELRRKERAVAFSAESREGGLNEAEAGEEMAPAFVFRKEWRGSIRYGVLACTSIYSTYVHL